MIIPGPQKRAKKRKLFEHFAEAKEKYEGECRIDRKTKALKTCPALAGVLAVHIEDRSRPGFELAPMIEFGTGKSMGPRLVYFVRRAEYIEVEHCPFCGSKVSAGRRASK